ncbi:MAG: SIS domain-containing protein [Angelakisella sp.]
MSEFYNEVLTQPQELRQMVQMHREDGFAAIRKGQTMLRQAKRIVFSGMGTSHYAPSLVQDSLAARGPILIEAGELYEYNMELLTAPDTLLILISQSGESIEVCRILEELPKSCQVLAITNDPSSTLGRGGACVLQLYATSEMTITNRTYTNTLGVLQLLCASPEGLEDCAESILAAAQAMETLLKTPQFHSQIDTAAHILGAAPAIHFIGRGGPGLVSARQASLVFSEGAKCCGIGCSTGTFHHGPMETCGAGHYGVVFQQQDAYSEKTAALYQKMASLGSQVVLIGQCGQSLPNVTVITMPELPPAQFAFVAAVTFELLLVGTAAQKGRVAGLFTTATKITRED